MKTNRRDFIQTMGAGAVGLGLAATSPAVTAQPTKAQQVTNKGGRKMIVQADDVGFSNVCNIGSFKTMEEGVVTVADIMLGRPGPVMRLKD